MLLVGAVNYVCMYFAPLEYRIYIYFLNLLDHLHSARSLRIKWQGVKDLRFSVFEHTVTGIDMRSKIKRTENKQHSKTGSLPSVCDQILKSSMFSVHWGLQQSYSLYFLCMLFLWRSTYRLHEYVQPVLLLSSRYRRFPILWTHEGDISPFEDERKCAEIDCATNLGLK